MKELINFVIFILILTACLGWMVYQKDQECKKMSCPVNHIPVVKKGLCFCGVLAEKQ